MHSFRSSLESPGGPQTKTPTLLPGFSLLMLARVTAQFGRPNRQGDGWKVPVNVSKPSMSWRIELAACMRQRRTTEGRNLSSKKAAYRTQSMKQTSEGPIREYLWDKAARSAMIY